MFQYMNKQLYPIILLSPERIVIIFSYNFINVYSNWSPKMDFVLNKIHEDFTAQITKYLGDPNNVIMVSYLHILAILKFLIVTGLSFL